MSKRVSLGLVWALSAGLLVGCASTPVSTPAPAAKPQADVDAQRRAEFDKSMARWHGATVTEMVGKLGPPSATTKQADGTLVYVYSKTGSVTGPTGPVAFSCVVRYQVDGRSNRVVGHRIEGC